MATRGQLQNASPDDNVDAWLRAGLLARTYRGVWHAPGAPETPHRNLMAAVLRCGDGARADGLATCWLLGIEGFEPSIGVVVPKGQHVTGAPFRVKATVIEDCDCRTAAMIPCLDATRALIEVAPALSDKALRVAIDSARRLGLISVKRLETRCRELATHTGARVLLRVLASGATDQESEGERVLARFLAGFGGFDGIEWGVSDVVPGRRLDAYFRDALLVLEYDGRDHHVLPTDRDADGLRDLEIRSVTVDGVSLEIIRITKGMLNRAPDQVREFVRRRREERRREIARASQ